MKTRYVLLAWPLWLLAGTVSAGEEARYLPTKQLYPSYLADPYGVGFHMQLRSDDAATIQDTGSTRLDLMTGANMPLYERKEADNPHHGWQLFFFGALRGQFDIDNSLDNVAWEGLYGLQAVVRFDKDVAMHFGSKHYSSHVGDEYMTRTGRARIGYTREEWVAGMACGFMANFTFYADIAHAFSLNAKALQDEGRVQMGLQYEKPAVFMDGRAGWYSALDLSAYEEDDWEENIAMQIGYNLEVDNRRWRLGLEYYDGRSHYGEFFQNRGQYAAIGVWLDL